MRSRKPYTEIRIEHNTEEEKEQFELNFDAALKEKGYKSRIEYFREQIRKLLKKKK